MSKSIYEEAEDAGREARADIKGACKVEDWQKFFLCWYSSKHPGFEATYRRFAVGFDPANKRWAEGNDG